MKAAIVSEWFSQGMGYAENCLPQAFVRIGLETHVFTSDLQVYGNTSIYATNYERVLGPASQPLGSIGTNDFTLHRLPRTTSRNFRLHGLEDALVPGGFDLIYGFEVNQELTRQLLEIRRLTNGKLFLESRLHESVYRRDSGARRIVQLLRNRSLGRELVRNCDKFFPIADDVQRVLQREFGIPRSMMETQGLGVDDSVFFANPDDAGAKALRDELGVGLDRQLLVYTGRLTSDKGVDLLIDAYSLVRAERTDVSLLLVGEGELAAKAANDSSIRVFGFQTQEALATIYRSADIGIWPKQESTSRYDAAACGLPLIVPSNAGDIRRLPITTLTFRPDSRADLAAAITSAANSRPSWSRRGSRTGFQLDADYSWKRIAERIAFKI